MKMMLADCRVKATIDVIRGKWKAVIIKALKDRNLGYGELRRLVPEPSKKVLTHHLRELEKDRIICRTVLDGRVVRTEYAITEYGRTLIPVLVVMRAWGKTHRELVLGYPKEPDNDADPCIPLTNQPNQRAQLKKRRLKRDLPVKHPREQKGAFLSSDVCFAIIPSETE